MCSIEKLISNKDLLELIHPYCSFKYIFDMEFCFVAIKDPHITDVSFIMSLDFVNKNIYFSENDALNKDNPSEPHYILPRVKLDAERLAHICKTRNIPLPQPTSMNSLFKTCFPQKYQKYFKPVHKDNKLYYTHNDQKYATYGWFPEEMTYRQLVEHCETMGIPYKKIKRLDKLLKTCTSPEYNKSYILCKKDGKYVLIWIEYVPLHDVKVIQKNKYDKERDEIYGWNKEWKPKKK